jgi:hypothetical protein
MQKVAEGYLHHLESQEIDMSRDTPSGKKARPACSNRKNAVF